MAAARTYDAEAIAHGCTGKGNDQVRFEVSTAALAPDLQVFAPVRGWGLTREQSIEYAETLGHPHHRHQVEPVQHRPEPVGPHHRVRHPGGPVGAAAGRGLRADNPTAIEPIELVITFEQGLPVALDGKRLPFFSLIGEVDRIVGSYGWGRIDMIENRRVGIKSREVYECPGALALLMAHSDLEDLTLERDLAHEKARLEPRYAELVYDGLWFSPLKAALDAFVAESQRFVSGEVRLALRAARALHRGRAAQRRRPVRLRPGHL